MSPKKRQKKNTNVSTNDNIKVEEKEKDVEVYYNHSHIDNTIIQDQDEDYEMAVIMDIIKMQEKEDIQRQEKEKQEKIEQQKIFELAIQKRDHSIKEILRKLKFLATTQNCFETHLVSLLENTINSQDLHIKINDNDMYLQIQCYLGLNNSKGVIRLTDEIKDYANNMFTLEHELA